MALLPPVSLMGDNLGQRHRHLNSLVRDAKQSGASIQDVVALPEETQVDRLFKIDLAMELKHVDYIISNLKDDDMLYVSRALKSTWLIDHRDIINPKYLEEVLFPEMIKPAVTKMKHWLYINLRDQTMCQEFYQYYKENTFEFALKFLSHCGNEFILAEAPKILKKLTTHSLKVLCETCPTVAKIFYDSLATDDDLTKLYVEWEETYYKSVKCVLKSDADVFLDITEKYFNIERFNRLSPSATDYILRHHKTRFTNKLELYVAYFLHIPTLAARLSVEECQEVVLKLARASYLGHWFEYKAVEPLIKRLSPKQRASFKNRVFVDKDIGDSVDKWPYDIPAPPASSDTGPHVFDDQEFSPVCGNEMCDMLRMPCMARCAMKCANYQFLEDDCMIKIKTDLDRLFDEFRFIGFERALHELGQRLGATGSADRRRDIFLVLVSKSGGRTEAVSEVLKLSIKHTNEPPHTRASILRSLVKRANVWRLPADDWKNFLEFGHGLGFDGGKSEAACFEGLHCVVIRQLLAGECEKAVIDAFLLNFSTLSEYSLKVEERVSVANGLQNMLAAAAVNVEPAVAAKRLGHLLDVLKLYRIRVEPTSPAVQAVVTLAERDSDFARPLLQQLYNARIARRELLQLNMEFRKDEAALVNALRHDPSVLELKRVVEILADRDTSFDTFTSKLVVYFKQNQDFVVNLRGALKEKITELHIEKKKYVKLARPLASLLGNSFADELRKLDAAGKERVKFAAALRASAHRARPAVNLAEWGWRKAGVKAVATRAMRCREIDRAALTRELAAERRTVRVALALSMRSTEPRGLLLETFASAAKLRPVAALHVALPYFRRLGALADPGVWDIVKPLFSSVDLKPRDRLRQVLGHTDWIPSAIRPDYCTTLYIALHKISSSYADGVLTDISKVLPETDETIEIILLQILDNTDKDMAAIPYPSIFIRYLLLSTNDEDVDRRFTKIGNRFLERLDTLRSEKDYNYDGRFDQLLESLLYNSAFLSSKYTACLLVIERIITWMQKFMPKEEHFKKYTKIHLTMLYFKAVRQSMKQMPEVFADPKRRKSEGVETVGFVFGRYIVKEVAELVSTYFDSIIELYTGALVEYLGDNFSYASTKATLIAFILKGILAEGVGIQRRLAVYVLAERRYELDNKIRKEIEEQMCKDKEIEIFVHAEIFV